MARLNEPAALSADAVEASTTTNATTTATTANTSSASSSRATKNSTNMADDYHSWPPMANTESSSSWATHPDRRRLARQNRELAKSNNWRGLRIRELETEQTYLLSQNLTLQTRILELEHELANNSARRIADHALDIKARLEEQLGEWGAMLSGLGLEPPRKRRSQQREHARELAAERRMTRAGRRSSFMRPSPSQRRLRDVALQIEDLGHIVEGSRSSYARMSMDPEQIMALRAQADDDYNDELESPELGPPPMSRFVDHRISLSPPKSPSPTNAEPANPGSPSPFSSPLDPQPDTHAVQEHAPREEQMQDVEPETIEATEMVPSPTPQHVSSPPAAMLRLAQEPEPASSTKLDPAPAETTTTSTAGLYVNNGTKRKFAMTNDDTKLGPSDSSAPTTTTTITSKAKKRASGTGLGRGRPRKSLQDAAGQAAREKLAASSRPPLAMKSTNEGVVNSPAKKTQAVLGKGAAEGDDKEEGEPAAKASPSPSPPPREKEKERPRGRPPKTNSSAAAAPFVHISAPPPTPVSAAIPAPAALESIPVSPASPTPSAPKAHPGTPPPAHFAAAAATDAARPSRRARSSVSYAEPNLRDKMRRPGKELADAVAIKNAQMAADAENAPSTVESSRSTKSTTTASSSAKGSDSVSTEAPKSPLAEKNHHHNRRALLESNNSNSMDNDDDDDDDNDNDQQQPLPSTVSTKRRQNSSAHELTTRSENSDKSTKTEKERATRSDIYDMPASTPSSPANTTANTTTGSNSTVDETLTDGDVETEVEPERERASTTTSTTTTTTTRPRASRRSSAAATAAAAVEVSKPRASRKRVSMAVSSKSVDRDEGGGEQQQQQQSSTGSRRRTMVL